MKQIFTILFLSFFVLPGLFSQDPCNSVVIGEETGVDNGDGTCTYTIPITVTSGNGAEGTITYSSPGQNDIVFADCICNGETTHSLVYTFDCSNPPIDLDINLFYDAPGQGNDCETTDLPPINLAVVPLPVELTTFDAKVANGNHVNLAWATSSELNNDYFLIEHSTDGRNFESIGMVDGAGTTNEVQHYEFTDKTPMAGQNFYRLQQIDFDGQYEYSDIVSVKVSKSGELVVNPTFASEEIVVMASDDAQLNGDLTIFNLAGGIVYSEKLTANVDVKTIDVSAFNNGYYLISVKNGQEVMTKRFVKMTN